jgi:hypothetical protein
MTFRLVATTPPRAPIKISSAVTTILLVHPVNLISLSYFCVICTRRVPWIGYQRFAEHVHWWGEQLQNSEQTGWSHFIVASPLRPHVLLETCQERQPHACVPLRITELHKPSHYVRVKDHSPWSLRLPSSKDDYCAS